MAAAENRFPAPSPLDDANLDRRNRRIYEMTQAQPLAEVLAEAQHTFAALLESIERLPDEYFTDPRSAAWFMQPYWRTMSTVPEAIINLSADHYEEHIPDLKAWIEKNDLMRF